MHILILCESMYGNTARVARAIGTGLSGPFSVELQTVDAVGDVPADVDVLVVGGPTYAHGVEATMKAFLDRLPADSLTGVGAAAFDNRLNWPKILSGAASKGIAERLERKGARIVAEPESFLVEDKDGPLLPGEEERATAWGRQLVTQVTQPA